MTVSKDKIIDLADFCELVYTKTEKLTFEKFRMSPKAAKLELVHTYAYGPTPVLSIGKLRLCQLYS